MEEAIELHIQFRPKKLSEVVGQDQAVKRIEAFLANGGLPHTIGLWGAAGVGKTTIARILRGRLGCKPRLFNEINCAESRGIDMVREIKGVIRQPPLVGKCRIWLLDEAASLTSDAQKGLLKLTEDVPKHDYFFLATTDPGKLIAPLKTRCTAFELKPLIDKDMLTLLKWVAEQAKLKVDSEEVYSRIIEVSFGSAREGVKLLNQIRHHKGDQLDHIQPDGIRKVAFDIAKALFWEKPDWKKLAETLKMVNEDAEQVRRLILAIASTEMLKANKNGERANRVFSVFQYDFFTTGKPGLVNACFEAIHR